MLNAIYPKGHQTSKNIGPANTSILLKPLSTEHAKQLHLTFENHHSPQGWCGYAVVDQVPIMFTDFIMSAKGTSRLGAVLFFNGFEVPLFLFRDLRSKFCLIDRGGRILGREQKIDLLLQNFQRKKLS